MSVDVGTDNAKLDPEWTSGYGNFRMKRIISWTDIYLEGVRAVVQELQHVPDVLGVLDHEVQLHVKLAPDQLKLADLGYHLIS